MLRQGLAPGPPENLSYGGGGSRNDQNETSDQNQPEVDQSGGSITLAKLIDVLAPFLVHVWS